MNMIEADAKRLLVCRDCGSEIDWCEACENEKCPWALCYRCMIVKIGREQPQPHTHGG
jgi:hypothetical protein